MIDAFASMPQYVDHIAPIWAGLPDDLRGTFEARAQATYRAHELGIRTGGLVRQRQAETPLTIVASYQDEQHVKPRPVVLIEHGAGQSYSDHDPSYPGGAGRFGVVLFICPNETVARRWREMYPRTPTSVVGCPKLDPWHGDWVPDRDLGRPDLLPLVVFSFHFHPPRGWPEAKPAWEHYQHEIARLARLSDEERGWRIGGHAHPRASEVLGWFRGLGVRTFHRFDQVLEAADVYAVDNSSTLYEFASTGRPVIVLNAPWYRRDVEHGLRFWEHSTVGVNVDEPHDLTVAVRRAIADSPEIQRAREHAVDAVYAYTDGLATDRAVAAIVAEYEAGHWRAWKERRDAHNPMSPAGSPALDGLRAEIVDRLRDLDRILPEPLAAEMARADEDTLRRLLADIG